MGRCRCARRRREGSRAQGSRPPGDEPQGSLAMKIEDWRGKINEIDQKLGRLLNERSKVAMEIGKLKREANLPLYQPESEREGLENAERANRGRPPDTAS